MKTIAIYHNKGGVGKTTTVVNLAAALSKRNKKVLIVDLDSQANTTFAVGLVDFGVENADILKNRNIRHVLSSEDHYSIRDVAWRTYFCTPSIDVVPSHIDLMSAEMELNSIAFINTVLYSKLKDESENYDYVIIDTPPSLNLFARIALIAADSLIIPSDLKPFANQGLANVKNLIKDVDSFRKVIGCDPLRVLGILASKISPNARFKNFTLPKRIQLVESEYGIKVLDHVIFERDEVAKCHERTNDISAPQFQSILDYKPNSKSAREFDALALDILKEDDSE